MEKNSDNRNDAPELEKEIHFLDFLIVLAKRKKLILSITLPVAVITIILTLFKTSFYEAHVSMIPPQEQKMGLASQFMNTLGIMPSSAGRVQSKQELLVAIMKSRTFAEKMVDRFNLKGFDGLKNIEGARKMFLEHVRIVPDPTDTKGFNLRGGKSPLTRIFVIDQNPDKAAEIANAIVEELKGFINRIAVSEAAKRRLFFEEQLKEVSKALNESEEELKEFQEKYGILKIETQTSIIINKIAELQAQMTAKEIELQVMQSYSTANNPEAQRLKAFISGLKKEVNRLLAERTEPDTLMLPPGTIPAIGLKYKRILRKLKYNENVYEIMVKQYELARIEESKEAVMIQVIDKAVPPKKAKTVRKFGRTKALAAILAAFVFSCFLAFFMEFYNNYAKNMEHSEKFETLKRYISIKRRP